jgi:hypothetical protein
MSIGRREAIVGGALAAGGAALLTAREALGAQGGGGRGWESTYSGGSQDAKPDKPGEPGKDYTPVVTPNGVALPFKIVDGVKVFHLVAEEVDHEFAPGLKAPVLGVQRPGPRSDDRGGGGRPRPHLRHEQAARPDEHPLARPVPARRDGRRRRLTQRSSRRSETFRYEFTSGNTARSCTTRTTTR